MNNEEQLLSIIQAAKLLNVSLPTFRKIRKESNLARIEVHVGKRVRFPKKALLELLGDSFSEFQKKKGKLTIFSTASEIHLEVKNGVFDLRRVELIDPFGAISLLTCLINRSNKGEKIELLLDSTIACKELKFVGFFDFLELYAPNVTWDKNILSRQPYFSSESLLPISILRRKGEERMAVVKLTEMLLQQGFSEDVGGYIGWLLGELADNSMTHSGKIISERRCFIQAQRYNLGKKSNCVIVAIGDFGQEIYYSLKTNPKYKRLSNPKALLMAFRDKVSSWADEFNRGKGLTDIVSIEMGNKSFLRVGSGNLDFIFDFQKKDNFKIEQIDPPLFDTGGSRFGLIFIDDKFEKMSREEADQFLEKEIEKYE